eukprot:m.111361 g.111361  ORF g.111361 m.111361 type:complete len:129 (+) comp19225_c0_seq10:58-444(+)
MNECACVCMHVCVFSTRLLLQPKNILGNQFLGVPESLHQLSSQTMPFLQLAFTRAADLHALHWRSQELLHCEWLKATQWYKGQGREQWLRAIGLGRSMWQAAKARFVKDPNTEVHFDPAFVAIVDGEE